MTRDTMGLAAYASIFGQRTMITHDSDLPDLLPTLNALSRADKLRVIQHLVVDLAQEEGVPMFEAGASYPIWTPFDAYDAAAVLMTMLETKKAEP